MLGAFRIFVLLGNCSAIPAPDQWNKKEGMETESLFFPQDIVGKRPVKQKFHVYGACSMEMQY